MKYIVEFTHTAELEADSAYEWILKDSPINALNWFEGLVESLDSLCSMPERCPIAPESEEVGQEIRHLLYGKFRILFSVSQKTVSILHIRHGAQDRMKRDSF